MQFKPFADSVEVNGQTVFSVVDGLGNFQSLARKYLLANGIGEDRDGKLALKANAWYSQADWLKAFESIAKDIGDSTLFRIGSAIPANAQFPPWVTDIHSAIKSIDIAYHLNHRIGNRILFDVDTGAMSEGIGHYGYHPMEGEQMIISECENPYPCSFDRGIITEMARKFEIRAQVVHDDSKPCRKNGAESCTYIITW